MASERVGVVVAAHGPLGAALIASAELIVGEQDQIAHVALEPLGTLEGTQADISAAIEQVDTGAGALLLIDLFGGTPGTAAALAMRDRHGGLVAGVNLPMMLEVLLSRDQGNPVETLVTIAVEAGTTGVQDVGAKLGIGGGGQEET